MQVPLARLLPVKSQNTKYEIDQSTSVLVELTMELKRVLSSVKLSYNSPFAYYSALYILQYSRLTVLASYLQS